MGDDVADVINKNVSIRAYLRRQTHSHTVLSLRIYQIILRALCQQSRDISETNVKQRISHEFIMLPTKAGVTSVGRHHHHHDRLTE